MAAPKEDTLSAMDYLLMLVAVLIAVGVAIFYVTRVAPTVIFGVTAENVDSENVEMRITHKGGDALLSAELVVWAENRDNELMKVVMTWGDNIDPFSTGEEGIGVYKYGADPSGRIVSVKVVHIPTGATLFENDNVEIRGR
jgi:hypothetical protein